MMDKEAKLHGIRLKEKEYLEQLNKIEKKQQRIDTLYTAWGLFGDVLEHPEKTKVKDVEGFIRASKADLQEGDLEELRKVFDLVTDDIDVTIMTVFPGNKKIEEVNHEHIK